MSSSTKADGRRDGASRTENAHDESVAAEAAGGFPVAGPALTMASQICLAALWTLYSDP